MNITAVGTQQIQLDLNKINRVQPKYPKEYKINIAVICVIAVCQGLIGISDLLFVLIQKNRYQMTQQELINIRFFIQIPWIIKPLWGMCSDLFPLFQYRRKSYLLIFGLLGFIFENILGHRNIENKYVAFVILFFVQLSIVFCNVIGEAVLVENSGLKFLLKNGSITDEQIQTLATRNVTIFFGMKALGNLINSLLQGNQSIKSIYCWFTYYIAFQITSFLPLIMGLMAFLLQEKQAVESQNLQSLQYSTKYSYSQFRQFIIQPAIYKPILFIFFFMATPSPATAMFYFYINSLKLDDHFFQNLKFAYSITTILAMILFYFLLKHIPFKKIFFCSNICYFTVSLLSIILITRLNITYGISDYQFCMSDNILMQVVSQINTIPVLVLACKMCPINIEASMYSMIMSSINLGGILSQHFGLLLTNFLGVSTKNFDNLWVLIIATNLASQIPMPFIGAVSEQDVINCQRNSFEKTRKLQIKDKINELYNDDEYVNLFQ